MKLAKVFTVFRKDLKDVLRDRRTLIFMLLLPTAALPLLMMGVTRFMLRTQIKREKQTVLIAIRGDHKEVFRRLLEDRRLKYDPALLYAALQLSAPESMKKLRARRGELSTEDQAELALAVLGRDATSDRLQLTKKEIQEFRDEARRSRMGMGISKEQMKTALGGEAIRKVLDMSEFVEPTELDALGGSGKSPPAETYPDWVREDEEALVYADAITSKRIQAALVLPDDLEQVLSGGTGGAAAKIYYDSTIPTSKEAESRLRGALKALGDLFLQDRLKERGLPPTFIEPVSVTDSNIAPRKKRIQALLGGMLPYVIILFCFLGAFYPAVDLGAGEKERFTLETLLLSPASRYEIAAGKFLVIFLCSMTAAVLGLASMAWTLTKGLPSEIMAMLDISFDPLALVVGILLTIPVASVFASILLSVSIYARSFKEAQTYAVPLQMLIILPAMASMIPGVEVSWKLAMIPIVNVSVVMREFMKGDYRWDFFAITLASTLLVAAIAIVFAGKWFNREEVIFRN
ncbi:MAG: ABC transporter permease subunit [Planctomycetota bacterium]|nr:ABC transporter permease subunit [Planctomycetota bacterium]